MTEAAAEVPPPGRIRHDAHPRRDTRILIGHRWRTALRGQRFGVEDHSGVGGRLTQPGPAAQCGSRSCPVRPRPRHRSEPACGCTRPSYPCCWCTGSSASPWSSGSTSWRSRGSRSGSRCFWSSPRPFWSHCGPRSSQKQQFGSALWLALALALGGLALVAEIWDGLSFDTVGVLAGVRRRPLVGDLLHRRQTRPGHT